jgi:drug/metabolite transporter (DMT)-like permease
MKMDRGSEAEEHIPRASGRPVVARLWVVLAAVLWSTSGWFAKNPIFDVWPPESRGVLLAFWRAAFAALLLLPFVRNARWSPHLIPLTVSFALMNATYLTAMTLTTAANAIWLQCTAPLWVCGLEFVFWRNPPQRTDALLLACSMLGVFTILAAEVHGQQQMGVAFGLFSGVFYAGVIVFLQRASGENSAWLIALCHLVAAMVLAPFVIQLGIWPSPRQFVWLAAFGFLQMGLPYLCMARGLRTVPSQEASGIALLEPILVPVWVFLAWPEPLKWSTWVGGGLILLGLLIRYLSTIFPRATP